MKNIAILFSLILSWNLQAQKTINIESEEMETRFLDQSKIPIVKGNLLYYSPEIDKDLVIEYHLVSLEEGSKKRYAEIAKDGTFKLQVDLPLPYQQIWLSIGDYYWGQIIVNEQLMIEADLKQLKKKEGTYYDKGVQFKGIDGELNIYYNKFIDYKSSEKRKFHNKHQALILNHQLDLSKKVKQYQENYKIWDNILESYIQKNPSPYATLLLNERDSEYYSWLYTFYWDQAMDQQVLKNAFQHQPSMISNSGTAYYNYLAGLLKNTSQEEQYQRIKEVLQKEVKDTDLKTKLSAFLLQYQLKLEEAEAFDLKQYKKQYAFFSDKYSTELHIARWKSFAQRAERFKADKRDILKLLGNPQDKWQQKDYYELMLPTITTKWVKQVMQTQLNETIKYIAEVDRTLAEASTLTESSSLGKSLKSFPFGGKLYQAEATDVANLVASIQNAFPGKTLILDVWATWCSPCIDDMKNSTESKVALKKLPVEVIYLCVEDGSSLKKWEKTVAGLKTEGTHVFLDKNLTNSVMEYFDLNGYPSHVFIDKKGQWDTNFIYSIANLNIEKLKLRLSKD